MINIRSNSKVKASKSKIRILHLEDNASDAELISHLLTTANLNFETQVVDNRDQYQKALIEFDPEIIISDHSLPAFNSMEALKILKLSGQKIPFMLVTGAVSEEFAIRAMQEGADDYILKDRMQRLPVAVTAMLEKYAQEREEYAKDALLRNIDINSLDMICSIDDDGRFVHISAASKTILNYEPSELQGKKYMDLVFEEDLTLSVSIATAIMAGSPLKTFENRLYRKDRTVVPIMWSARWDDTEGIMYCVGKDVSEHKNSDKIIESARKRLGDLFLMAPVSMCIMTGKDHVFELANPIFLQKYGKQDVVGRAVKDVFPEESVHGIIDLLDAAFISGDPFSLNESRVMVDQDGDGKFLEKYLNLVYQPYRNSRGDVEGIFHFGIDVTDQVLMRQKIELSKKEYVHLIENLPAALYTCDAVGKVTLYNKAAVELWGREPDLQTDLWCGSWQMLHKDNTPISREHSAMAQAISEGQKINGEEIIIKREDGTSRNVIPYPSPSFNAMGEVTGAFNVLVDITDRKKIEMETLTLVDLLQFKNRELKQFAYMVSHNLRAPIARILGLASVFGHDVNENIFILDKINEATKDLDDVVKDINLVVSARNSEDLKMEYVDFQTQVELIMQVHEKEIAESSAVIDIDFHKARGLVTVRSYIYSIIQNLLSNAIKYRLPTVPLCVNITSSKDQKFTCLSVKDNGMGIDLVKNREKLFGLYKRFHSNAIPGKGVGLHLVKTHVESLGGRVEVESRINEGIEFKIYLPNDND